jgi:nucleoside-diphosphate-sugar epimerase
VLPESQPIDEEAAMAQDLGGELALVTGAAGWLGQAIVKALTQGLPDDQRLQQPQPGLKLRCLVLAGESSPTLEELGDKIEIVRGDMRNPSDCARFCHEAKGAVLFHMAGVIHPGRVGDFYQINVEGTRNILDAAQAAGVRRAVVVSSNSPCGCNPSRDHLFDESSPYKPYMNYGRSKMLMEQAVHALQKLGRLQTVIVRPPWFYGPYQPPRQSLFFRMIRDGKAPIVGNGENLRSMAYIDNLSQGLILAAAVPEAVGQTYWVADERPYTMNEVIDTIERLLEDEFDIPCAHKRLRLPSVASEVAWLADKTLQSFNLYHQKIHVLSEMNKTIACSVDKAKRELGYLPAVALEEGMRRSLRWTKERNLI